MSSIQEVIAYCQKWESERDTLSYEIDGMVVKVNSYAQRLELGETARSPRWAVAYKYPPRQKETKVRTIELGVGRTGVVTPVAVLDPVNISGATITHSTLHNMREITRKDIRVGDTVIVERAGEVIPQVVRVVLEKRPADARPFRLPRECPSCGSRLVQEGEEVAWRCINASCPAQIKARLQHFASRDAMDIAGMGERVIAELVDQELVQDFAGLYELDSRALTKLPRVGEKTVNNLLTAIEQSRTRPYPNFIFALGIRHVGITIARLLAKHFPDITALRRASREQLSGLPGIGPVIAESVANFMREPRNVQLLDRLQAAGLHLARSTTAEALPLAGLSFVFTGTLSQYSRSQAQALVIDRGGTVSSTVTAKTSFVVVGSEPGSKLERARKLGVPIVTEQEFIRLLQAKPGKEQNDPGNLP